MARQICHAGRFPVNAAGSIRVAIRKPGIPCIKLILNCFCAALQMTVPIKTHIIPVIVKKDIPENITLNL